MIDKKIDWRFFAKVRALNSELGPKEIMDYILNNKDADTSDMTYNKVKCIVYKTRKRNKDLIETVDEVDATEEFVKQEEEKKEPVLENFVPTKHDAEWKGQRTITFGLVGDTHLGSKYTQLSYLKEFYEMCKEMNITDIYHCGDITDGLKMRPGHEYELYKTSADELVTDVVEHYPNIDGITTHFICGNHDASLYKHVGYDIGQAISMRRKDLDYLGRDWAKVYLTPNCTLELRHPWDGTSYAISYKAQKMIESMEPDSKPNILAIGHYHKNMYLFYRNIHCFMPGCFQSQTPFSRGRGLLVSMGGWIITVNVDEDGTISFISSCFVPFYSPITDDFKNYIK